MSTIERSWQKPISAHGMVAFFGKLMRLRKVLKGWNQDSFGHIGNGVQLEERKILKAQELYDRYGREKNHVRLGKAKAEHTCKLSIEREFWRQKAMVKWMKDGDTNTSYFHAIIRQRWNRNFIAHIKQDDGTWLQSNQEIKSSNVEFFSSLFGFEAASRRLADTPFALPNISSQQWEVLELLPTEEEVKSVVFGMDKDSAAGSDGFSMVFYQNCWQIIKQDLMEAVCDFFLGGSQPKGFTSTMVVLIPKKDGAARWNEFRLISLCNVSSKILSKILALRVN